MFLLGRIKWRDVGAETRGTSGDHKFLGKKGYFHEEKPCQKKNPGAGRKTVTAHQIKKTYMGPKSDEGRSTVWSDGGKNHRRSHKLQVSHVEVHKGGALLWERNKSNIQKKAARG